MSIASSKPSPVNNSVLPNIWKKEKKDIFSLMGPGSKKESETKSLRKKKSNSFGKYIRWVIKCTLCSTVQREVNSWRFLLGGIVWCLQTMWDKGGGWSMEEIQRELGIRFLRDCKSHLGLIKRTKWGKTLPVMKSIDYETASKGSSVCLLRTQPMKALKTACKRTQLN